MDAPWYQRGYRRMLVDMHIPDWDERFLSKFDPARMVRLYKTAGLTSVMYYAQSHVGLCYWPTKTGKMHAGLRGRDIVGETLALLRKAKIDACIYYSVIYNNWAYLEHPEWRLVPAGAQAGQLNGGRYGRCCPNNPGYRSFALAQTAELVGGYRFDGIFFDMTFWPRVCICEHCRAKLRAETGCDIPQTIDWLSPAWCEFQAARERWMIEFATALRDQAKAASPGITTYSNFASSKSNWVPGVSFRIAKANDIIGADFYGDPVEQLTVCKFMSNVADNRPVEFMTSRCVSLVEHEHNKSAELIRMQAMAATLFSAATFFIDAIDPDGTVNPEAYRMLRRVYREARRYEPFLGGEPVEDVGVYFSSESKMDFAENGRPLAEAGWKRSYPHLQAVRGFVRVLQQAHVPFGVITRKQLGDLARYKVVILPNVLRMDAEEAEAIRRYVHGGGNLYASRYTSLTETRGVRHADFMLADVFGCHLAGDDLGDVTYLKPVPGELAEAIRPQAYLSHMYLKDSPGEAFGTLRLADRAEGEVLATLALPYAKDWGTVNEQNWSSIHSSPPWQDTDTPVIVRNRFGEGQAIYLAADIECKEGQANTRLLTALILDLLAGRQSAAADTYPFVWMSVMHQPVAKRFVVGFLNYPSQLPAVPIAKVPFSLRPPAGSRFTRLTAAPRATPIPFTTDPDGTLRAKAPRLRVLQMLLAEYA
ncbi:MAG TPA: beta-galactosidase trimerization domain-containing protein [Phycisphaerae bacterium]|nr:beta-galactosidase trimerization domain-containing protein [Phycisphaerae bacterium]